ncbi:MAG TPA: glutamate-cysteine ligase family protein [Alphaproteobacteria bacterium]|nr:glutamate-cysteine ligase family protein [Alphaproteobacteria bacterium]
MSRVYRSQNPNHIFTSRAEIAEHLLAKIAHSQGGKTGTELELFVATPEGAPPTFDQIEMLFDHIAARVPGATKAGEQGRTVGLGLPSIGDISLEPGGQVELSTKPCADMRELESCNRRLRDLLNAAADFYGLTVEGAGHKPAFLDAQDMPRSRFHAYYAYCREQYGQKAEDLIETMKSCCGLQVNVDPMGDDFHEIYRALLLVDVAESLATRSTRQQRLHETYAALAPEQMTPVFEALGATNNEQVVEHMLDRLLTLKIPFVPDAEAAEGFRSTKEVFGRTPRVGDLLHAGKLTAEILDNALSLQLTMPNLRRHGVLETRAPDSMDDMETLMQVSRRYHGFAYDAQKRGALLAAFADVDADKLKQVFASRFDTTAKDLMAADIGGGKTVGDLIAAVRADRTQPSAAPVQTARTAFKKQKGLEG